MKHSSLYVSPATVIFITSSQITLSWFFKRSIWFCEEESQPKCTIPIISKWIQRSFDVYFSAAPRKIRIFIRYHHLVVMKGFRLVL
jgi:hypothetical protein